MQETISVAGVTKLVDDKDKRTSVFASEVLGKEGSPFQYAVRDKNGKLLGHFMFKEEERDGMNTSDLLCVLIDRLRSQQETISIRERGFALARAEESLLWLRNIKENKK